MAGRYTWMALMNQLHWTVQGESPPAIRFREVLSRVQSKEATETDCEFLNTRCIQMEGRKDARSSTRRKLSFYLRSTWFKYIFVWYHTLDISQFKIQRFTLCRVLATKFNTWGTLQISRWWRWLVSLSKKHSSQSNKRFQNGGLWKSCCPNSSSTHRSWGFESVRWWSWGSGGKVETHRGSKSDVDPKHPDQAI